MPEQIPRPSTAVPTAESNVDQVPRWVVIVGWSLGPAALYALLGLGHAALVERSLTVEVGFGRSLAFWVGLVYLALPLWGFLPARPSGWYARAGIVRAMMAVGAVGLLVCGGFSVAWLTAHWNPTVGAPVVGSGVVLVVAVVATLWFASRGERGES